MFLRFFIHCSDISVWLISHTTGNYRVASVDAKIPLWITGWAPLNELLNVTRKSHFFFYDFLSFETLLTITFAIFGENSFMMRSNDSLLYSYFGQEFCYYLTCNLSIGFCINYHDKKVVEIMNFNTDHFKTVRVV